MLEEVPWQRLLRDALAVLALPAEQQVNVNGPGCVACDMLNDFDHARIVAIGNAPALCAEQRSLIDLIDATMKGMKQPDFECLNNEVVRRPVWQRLRELAAEALRAFGWGNVRVRPFMEVEPGVWKRPLSEGEPGVTEDGSCEWNVWRTTAGEDKG
jgi:hypothetical protein